MKSIIDMMKRVLADAIKANLFEEEPVFDANVHEQLYIAMDEELPFVTLALYTGFIDGYNVVVGSAVLVVDEDNTYVVCFTINEGVIIVGDGKVGR